MLGSLRNSLGTWPVRLLYVVLIGAFGVWGVGDVIRSAWQPGWVAKVAGREILPPEVASAYQRQLAQVTRSLGTQVDPTPQIRRAVAAQALEQLIAQAAVAAEVADLRLAVPDGALRQVVFDMPAFRGPDGRFSKSSFDLLMRNNGLTEARFLELIRADLGQQQLLAPVRAGAAVPDVLLAQVFAFQRETRMADIAEFAFAAAPDPPAPDAAALTRWWENHPDSYSTPELRRIKAVVLSADTLAKGQDVPDADIAAYYDQHKAEFAPVAKRSVQVILVQDEAKANELVALWRGGADWARMEQAARDAGAAPVELEDAAAAEFPTPELSAAVFAATVGAVADPVHSPLGWHVLKVTRAEPATVQTLAEATPEIRTRLARERGADQVDAQANKVEDALAGGAKLDELPGDLGLAAVTGTLDAKGNTADGAPAPIPGGEPVRAALVSAAFAAKPGDPPHLANLSTPAGPVYYAFTVDEVHPAAQRPLDAVRDAVLADWTADARRRTQEQAAATLLAAVKGGQSMADAATVAGVTPRRSPPVSRQGGVEGVPSELVEPLFTLKQGEPTMVTTPDGFVVAVLAEQQDPSPADDPQAAAAMRVQLTRSIGDDYETVFANALRARGNPQVNRAALDSIVQPDVN